MSIRLPVLVRGLSLAYVRSMISISLLSLFCNIMSGFLFWSLNCSVKVQGGPSLAFPSIARMSHTFPSSMNCVSAVMPLLCLALTSPPRFAGCPFPHNVSIWSTVSLWFLQYLHCIVFYLCVFVLCLVQF